VEGVSIDTRDDCGGTIFVAIEGENADGHDYLEDAVTSGAKALLVSKKKRNKWAGLELPVFEVEDTVKALQRLSSDYKDKIGVRSVGVTGSTGKTETKEMLASILAEKYRVHATPGNYNNHIGLPLTILSMDEETEILVIEMGASRRGEIKLLAEIGKPDIGIITNIGPGHLEFFRSLKGVAEAKSELISSFSEENRAVLPADDDFFEFLKEKTRADIVSFGFSDDAQWSPREVETVYGGGYKFLLGGQAMRINSYGRYHLLNAVAAAAAAACLDVSISDIARAIGDFRAVERRGRIFDVEGIVFVNDSYNSNPLSLKSSVEAFMEMPVEGRAWLVLGDMLELGPESGELHREVGRFCGRAGVYGLITMGKESVEISREASIQRKAPDIISHFMDIVKLSGYLNELLKEGDAVLIKGSRNMGMWKLIDEIEILRETPKRRVD